MMCCAISMSQRGISAACLSLMSSQGRKDKKEGRTRRKEEKKEEKEGRSNCGNLLPFEEISQTILPPQISTHVIMYDNLM